MVEALFLYPCYGAADCIWSQPHVRIGEKQEFAPRLLRAEVEGMIFAQPTRRQFADMNDAQSGMMPCHALQYLRGGISRAVIEHNDLYAGIGQGQH